MVTAVVLSRLAQSLGQAELERLSLGAVTTEVDAAALADQLKAEAERQLFIVPSRAMPIAAAIETLGDLVHNPSLMGLGALAAADALREQGRYPDALREYDRAAGLYLSVLDEVGWARTRLGAASTRVYTVELGPALEEAEKARAILAERKLWVRLARLESAVGNLLRELGRTREALVAHARAAEAAQRVDDPDERELVTAEVRINQSSAYRQLDEYDRAEALLQQAAATFQRYGRPGPVAVAEGNLARAFAARGHLSRALALAIEVRQSMLALGRIAHAAVFGQVAVGCLLDLNRAAEAVALADEIVPQFETCEAGVELAKALLQRAVGHERLAHYADAAADLARAETLFTTGGCQGWAAIVRVQRAEVLLRGGALSEALAEADRASRDLHARQQLVAAARADLVRAAVLHRLHDLDAARAAAHAARRIARRIGVPLLEYQAWRLLADLATDQADDHAALPAASAAIAALEKSQGRILTEQRASFLEDKLVVYETAIRLALAAGDTRQAFRFAERSKARALIDALALRHAGVPLRPNTPRARAMIEELAALRQRYDRLSSTLLDPRPQDDLGASALAGAAAILRQELEACEARIGRVLERLQLAGAADVERLALLQGKVFSPLPYLGSTSALVQYAVIGKQIVIFVARRGHALQARAVPGDAAQLGRLRSMLELNLAAAAQARHQPHQLALLERQIRGLLHKLDDLLMQPAVDLLQGVQRLVIVPQGLLHGIPFGALHDGTRFLVERYELVLAPSASALKFTRQRHLQPDTTSTDSPTDHLADSPTDSSADHRPGHLANGVADCLVVAHSADGALPGALREADAVVDLFGGQRLIEQQATLAGLRAAMPQARIVHIAAHGVSRPDAPLFSHLRLADGHLTALDCLDLNLQCELVTLSACETGRAVVAPGDEPIGLTRSLLYAGARSVIQSLWRVDDDATRQLMSDMYAHLRRGAGRAEALGRAQRTALRTHAHPALWAAFELVGDWAPLHLRPEGRST